MYEIFLPETIIDEKARIAGKCWYWLDFITAVHWLRIPSPNIADAATELVGAGYVPFWWKGGDFPNGVMVVYAPPGRPPLPPECIADAAAIARTVVPKRQPIDRSTLPVADFPAVTMDDWQGWSVGDAKTAAAAFFRRLPLDPAIVAQPIADLSALVERIQIQTQRGKTRLELHFTAGEIVRIEPAWTGSVAGLPAGAVKLVRAGNGLELVGNAPAIQVYTYHATKGFAVRWKEWEIADNRDGLWTKPPLVPFTDGYSLWAYHPAETSGDTLKLVRIDHDAGTIEAEPNQDPGTKLLEILALRLKSV
ncbi:hypothetical protein LBMAG53_22910 [Planctomycetota bacterium]|nr:hypothetical protein LBMAG53_22910 [Planctomycetota bacterium]